MRFKEVVTLSFNCIYKDKSQDYFLRYYLAKIKKEHVIPITEDLANIIKEQQRSVQSAWGKHELLFPVPHKTKQATDDTYRVNGRAGQQWCRKTVFLYLKRFAEHYNIRDENGDIFTIKFHEFRHTLATKMINNDVPQHIVQRFLGHESPSMTAVYAHILDQTLKKAFIEFKGKNVSITGEVIESKDVMLQIMDGTQPKEIDALWLKKNIMAQALPNGTCALPAISKSCPHANACLTCTNFRTDHRYLKLHKQQLTKTKAIIKQAKKNNWERQLEMNNAIKDSLEKIIHTLEEAV